MKRFLFLIAFVCLASGSFAQTDPMMYFIGKWKFNVWFAGSRSSKPDLKATWILEKEQTKHFEASGKVLTDENLRAGQAGTETTKEMMGYNEAKGLYSRTVTSKEGLFFFTSSGWKGNTLTWEGYLVPLSDQRIPMKEEITRISDDEFHAVFYKKVNEEWVLMTKEVLKRIKT